MRLSALQPLLLVPIFCGILSVASPGITTNTAGPEMTADAPVHNEEDLYNFTREEHNISIAGLSTKDNKKDIVINDTLHLKLVCYLVVDSKDLQINVSWRHGGEKISSNLYAYNNTGYQWNTTYEFVVTDINKTGDYTCIFSSVTEVKGTFSLQVPLVYGGSKGLVTYNGDSVALKCHTNTHNPQRWLWYKVMENELVALNLSSDSKRYKELSKKGNETNLSITDLSESDSGDYVCKAEFKNVESEGRVHIVVLSYMVPLKVFLVIAGEVAILVAVILVYEFMSKKKQNQEDDKKDYEPMSQLKSEDSSLAEAGTTRQRKA